MGSLAIVLTVSIFYPYRECKSRDLVFGVISAGDNLVTAPCYFQWAESSRLIKTHFKGELKVPRYENGCWGNIKYDYVSNPDRKRP